MRANIAAALGLIAATTSLQAETQYVTNPEMCGLDAISSQEMGMTLTAEDMSEIEYLCEFAEPISLDWSEDRVQSPVGYCSEPGLISPEVWAVGTFQSEPGVAYVWWQGADEPTVFKACQ